MNRVVIGYPGFLGRKCLDLDTQIPEKSVDDLYIHLQMQYLDRGQASAMLEMWQKALKPGGKITIQIFDARKVMQWYLSNRCTLDQVRDWGFSGFSSWDETDLYEAMTKAGFIGVRSIDAEEFPYMKSSELLYSVMEGSPLNG